MIYNEKISGHYVELCSALETDSEFTLAIRKDPEFSKFFPEFDSTVEKQREWIKKQQEKDDDYFFVVWDKEGKRIGTISIYNIKKNTAEAGRLAIRGNALQCIEAQLLAFKFAFEYLDLKEITSYIFFDNERALRFSQQFGGVSSGTLKDENGYMYRILINEKSSFEMYEKKLSTILYRERKAHAQK